MSKFTALIYAEQFDELTVPRRSHGTPATVCPHQSLSDCLWSDDTLVLDTTDISSNLTLHEPGLSRSLATCLSYQMTDSCPAADRVH